MFDEDPMESAEAAAESWAAENVDGDRFKCKCGKWKPLAESLPSGPSPYAIPICRECADAKFVTLAIFSRGEVETSPDGELLAIVGSDYDGRKYWEPWDPAKDADQADEIIMRIRDLEFGFRVEAQPRAEGWTATFFDGDVSLSGQGETARIATCRAAMHVLDAIEWKEKPDGKS